MRCGETGMNETPNLIQLNADMVRRAISAVIENLDVTNIDDDQSFESMGLDSLDEVSILIELEDRYGVSVEECDVAQCNSITGIVDYFQSAPVQMAASADS